MSLTDIIAKKQVFTLVVGKLLENYFTFDRERAAQFQAGLVALKVKLDRSFNAYVVRSEEDLQTKLAENTISEDELASARGLVDTEDKGGVLKDVPPLGEIGVKLGMIDQGNKDLMMYIQAAVRALDAVEAASYGTQSTTNLRLRELVYDLDKQPESGKEGVTPEFARSFIGKNSPDYLTKAQALSHLADVLGEVVNQTSCECNGLLMSIEALAVDMLNDACTRCENLGDKANPKLKSDLKALTGPLNIKIKRANRIELAKDGAIAECLADVERSINLVIEAISAGEVKAISDTNIGDIDTLMKHRFNQVTTAQAALEPVAKLPG